MNYTKKAIQGATFVLIFKVAANFLSYLTRMLLARNLTPSEYGLFYSVFTFVIFFLFFRSLGLDSALIKFIPEFKIKKQYNKIKTAIGTSVSFQLISSTIISIIFFISADWLALNYFKDPLAAPMLKFLIIYIVLSIFWVTIRNTLQGFQKMITFSTTEFTKTLVLLIIIFISFKFFQGPFIPVLGYVLLCPILIIIFSPFFLKTFNILKYKITKFKPTSKQMLTFGIPVFATSVGSKIIGYIDTLLLTHYSTLDQVGIYNVILPTALILLFFGTAVSQVIFPMSSELWANHDKKRLADALRFLHNYTFLAAIPVILTVFTFPRFLINLFFGQEYIQGALAFQILLIGVLFYVVAVINNNIISGIGKPKTVTYIILGSAILNIILNIIAIPRYGIQGAAASTSLSYLLALITSTIMATKYIKTKLPVKPWLKLTFLAIVFFTITLTTKLILNINPWFEIIIAVSLGSIIYLILAYLLKSISIKEIKMRTKLFLK